MASIKKLSDKPRTLPWRAKAKGKVRMFKKRDEAERWADEYERTVRLTGLPPTIEELKKHIFGDLVRRYLKDITPTKGCRVSETTVLNKFLRHKICSRSLPVSRQEAYEYVNDRLKGTWKDKPIKASTVRREINTIQHIFEVAREQWGFTNLQNPFRALPIKGSMHRRKRRLRDGELEKLLMNCRECRGLNEYYVPLAISLAIETGMRLQEIFNLVWLDADFDKLRLHVQKSKTDHATGDEGRTIVLTPMASLILLRLAAQLILAKRFNLNDRIFPMTKGAFQQSFSDVCKRAGIKGLQFRDLRHEAASRFDEAGLTKGEHDLMMGHASRDMRSVYVHANLKSIQDKLEKYALKGKTFEQIEHEMSGRGLQELSKRPDSEKAVAWLNGLPSDEAQRHIMVAGISREELVRFEKLLAKVQSGYQLPSPVPERPRVVE